jgi:GTP-binding protein
MLHDRAKIHVEAGTGGNGAVSFRREAHVPRGGPDGGDGGRGGDIVLVCDASRRDLATLRYSPHQRAGRGGHGDDAVVLVPPGTEVHGIDGRRYDLVEPGQRAVVAAGGLGGHGNKRFTSSTRQAPRFAESGLPGEEGWIEVRLKLLADAGLVGLPNAGKSSLLRRLTRAVPKVAGYPFTTLEPALGTIDDGERQLVLADIPGLIEGAAEGAGLGHEFLAHIERCRALVHLVALDENILDTAEQADALVVAYETIRGELDAYGAGLAELPEIICVSKADLLPADDLDQVLDAVRARFGPETLAISSATGAGLDTLRNRVYAAVPAEPDVGRSVDAVEPEFEAEHLVYTPAGDGGFDVVREDDAFRVTGRGVEMLVARHDLSNLEALAYLEQRLREIGVIAALERAGFEHGGDVRIGDEEFELE